MEHAQQRSDLNWPDLNYKSSDGYLCQFFLFTILFLLSVILVTPVSLLSIVDPVVKEIENKNEGLFDTYGIDFRRQLSPLLLAIVNSGVIPVCCDTAATLALKETKSDKQIKSLILNLLFMGLNMIFLPLTGLVSLNEFVTLFA